MEQLAAMAGISRATLCRCFATREAMLDALHEQAVRCAQGAFEQARVREGSAEQALRRLIDEWLPIAELYACIDKQQGCPEKQGAAQALNAALTAQLQQWQQSGELRMDLPASWLVESMLSLLRSAAAMIRNGELARNDAARSVHATLCGGIGTRAAAGARPGKQP